MALFPRFGTASAAKAATVAKALPASTGHDASFRNCRNFRDPAGLRIQQRAESEDHLAQRVADIADTYAERIAIVLEAGDIGEAEARRIAEAEIGAAFVQTFLPSEATEIGETT